MQFEISTNQQIHLIRLVISGGDTEAWDSQCSLIQSFRESATWAEFVDGKQGSDVIDSILDSGDKDAIKFLFCKLISLGKY